MNADASSFWHEGNGIELSARRVSWDESAFGTPVACIDRFHMTNDVAAQQAFDLFEDWRNEQGVSIVSCRLALPAIDESMFLEGRGFRFVETILVPRLDGIRRYAVDNDGFRVSRAGDADLAQLRQIADSSFASQRYHVDPRIDTRIADRRYVQWIDQSMAHPTQKLLKITSAEGVVGLFIVEHTGEHRAYWHLTAMADGFRGRGLAKGVWRAVLAHHAAEGIDAVSTRIAAVNIAALNLYASLDFRFDQGEMTFHWVADTATRA